MHLMSGLRDATDQSRLRRLGIFLLQCSNQIAGGGGSEQDSKDEAPPERKRMRLFDHRKEEIIAIM
jgi:hypothetical protein